MPFEITEPSIDPKFLARARKHIAATGLPLLEGPAKPRHVLLANGVGTYCLTDASAPEIPTFRQFAKLTGRSEQEIREEFDNPDLDLDTEYQDAWQSVPGDKTPSGRAFYLLEDYEFGQWRKEDPDHPAIGYVSFTEGAYPGNDYVGVDVSSPLALSCVQYLLNKKKSGIRIELN